MSESQSGKSGDRIARAGHGVICLFAAGLLAGGAGCVGRAQLAADSLSSRPGQLWPADPQWVHVGETVRFSLLVKPALDDYAILDFPDRQVLLLADPVREGYRTEYTFTSLPASPEVRVKANIYRVRGGQDRMMVNDRILTLQVPDDPEDAWFAGASIRLAVYQSRVEFSGLGPRTGVIGEPDWSKTFLVLWAAEGGKVKASPRIGRQTPGVQGGYRIEGPDRRGDYTVTYLPTADQVSRGGTTEVELNLVDGSGRTHVTRKTIKTP